MTASMNAVLDDYGIRERSERRSIKGIWRAMYAEEAKVSKAERDANMERARQAAKR